MCFGEALVKTGALSAEEVVEQIKEYNRLRLRIPSGE
jgi:hypothetical protein